MGYQALYRKYRPHVFSDVVGQEHIITILKNQISTGHVAHAYLFCGTRGTGKTSTAKIFARAVNCLSPMDGSPCGKCEACRISAGESLDIVEMDAASNTGVGDMRQLMDKASFTPLQLGKKVYIIDEAHMLSQSAFNALLKTLEEPPSHIMFIFATTEPQRLPATITSRCQRFDFKRISVSDIVARLKDVLDKTDAAIDDEGLLAIARASDGALRDALSLADQCISFCGEKITADMVYQVLGSVDERILFPFADALLASDTKSVFLQLRSIVDSGRDLGVFVHDLASHLRALLMAKLCGSCGDLLDCTEDAMQRYIEQAKGVSPERLTRSIDLLLKTQSDMRWLTLPRVLIESTLYKICKPEEHIAYDTLADRVHRLERDVKNGIAVRYELPLTDAPKSEASEAVINPSVPDGKASAERVKAFAKTQANANDIAAKLADMLQLSEPMTWSAFMQRKGAFISDDILRIAFENNAHVEHMRSPSVRTAVESLLFSIAPELKIEFTTMAADCDYSELRRFFGNILEIED